MSDEFIEAVFGEIHDKTQEWIRTLDSYMCSNKDFRAEFVELESALRCLSTAVHYLLKNVHTNDEEDLDLIKRLIECKTRIVHLVRKVDDETARELEDVESLMAVIIDRLWTELRR